MDTICPDDGANTIAVQEQPSATHAAGTVVADRYRIDKVIGIGGFGAVYRCTQLNLNQTVAVKVLRNEHLTSVEHVKRFTREAQAVSQLKHPNTIRVSDFGVHSDGALYIVMEYIEGVTLGHRLDQATTVHWETLVHIMAQVCHSLTEAHSVGLIHRDLKPENIMLLSVAGDPNFVKVLDFGIAKVQKTGGPSDQSLTEAGMIMGTPTYMSPEQAKGEPIDARSDIYSLGVMMYEALTGKPPFQGESPMTVLVAHIKDLPRPMPRDGSIPNVPPALEKVVLSCLEKEPAKRPQSAVQLVDRLVTAARSVREPQATALNQLPEPTAAMAVLGTGMIQAVPQQGGAAPSHGSAGASLAAPAPQTGAPAQQAAHPPSRVPLWIGLGAFGLVTVVAVAVALVSGGPPNAEPAATPPAPAQLGASAASEPSQAAAETAPGAGEKPGVVAQPAAADKPAAKAAPAATLPAPVREVTAPAEPASAKAAVGKPAVVEAGQAKPIEPAQAKPIEPAQAKPIEPAQAKGGDGRPVAAKAAEPGRPAEVARPAEAAPSVEAARPTAHARPDAKPDRPREPAGPKPGEFRLDD